MYRSAESDTAILARLGERLARQRLNRDWSQEKLAEEAGVSVPTVSRLERGRSTSLTNLLRVLRALDLVGNLDGLVPEPPVSPMLQLRTMGRRKQRASRGSVSSDQAPSAKPWTWGDER